MTLAEVTGLTRRALGKIDQRGPRGIEQLTQDEVTAMALSLILLGVAPADPGPSPDVQKGKMK